MTLSLQCPWQGLNLDLSAQLGGSQALPCSTASALGVFIILCELSNSRPLRASPFILGRSYIWKIHSSLLQSESDSGFQHVHDAVLPPPSSGPQTAPAPPKGTVCLKRPPPPGQPQAATLPSAPGPSVSCFQRPSTLQPVSAPRSFLGQNHIPQRGRAAFVCPLVSW